MPSGDGGKRIMNTIANTVTQSALSQILPSQAGQSAGQVDVANEARFQEAMRGDLSKDKTSESVFTPFQDATPGQGEPTMGDKILNGLKKVEGNYNDTVNAAQQQFAKIQNGNADAETLIQMQYDLNTLSIETDFVSKIAGEASQGIQTMMRNQ